uniref:hypothetical protein n=1 Tax=Sphingomonas populi TaxID=2484750 RepID=UPI0013EE6933|nr:hypothetical protein [Sphingomonas populi]
MTPATAIVTPITATVVSAITHIAAIIMPAAIVANVTAPMIHPLGAAWRERSVVHLGRRSAGHADTSSHKAGGDDMGDLHLKSSRTRMGLLRGYNR